MTRILQEAAAVAAAMAAASQQPGGAAAAGSSTAAAPAGVETPEAWGFAANGTPPSLPRFVKALDERLINTMQETVMNVNGIFLQVCAAVKTRRGMLAYTAERTGNILMIGRHVVHVNRCHRCACHAALMVVYTVKRATSVLTPLQQVCWKRICDGHA
jgi:hypothetical protein